MLPPRCLLDNIQNEIFNANKSTVGLPAEQKFGMVLALQVAFDEIRQQVFEDVGRILQPALERRHDERSHVSTVAHREGALQLQCPDERQQENLVVHQLSKLLQGLLHAGLATSRHLGAQEETVTEPDNEEIKAKNKVCPGR